MRLVTLCILLLFTGCAYAPIAVPVIGYTLSSMIAEQPLDYQCQIRSNTEWTGTFTIDLEEHIITGMGDTTMTFENVLACCVSLQKQTVEGYLLLQIVSIKDNAILPKDHTVYTTAAQGKVRICLP